MDDIINNALNALHTNNQLMATRAELATAQENYHLLNERVAKIIAAQELINADFEKLRVKIGELQAAGRALHKAASTDSDVSTALTQWEEADNNASA